MTRAPLQLSLACLVAALAACAGMPRTVLESLRVEVDADANGGNASALDLVFVFDEAKLAALPKNGPAWFQDRGALLADLARSAAVVHLELPAGASKVDVALPKGYDKAIAVYSYANYLDTKGQARGNLTPYRSITLRLAADHIDYQGR